MVFRPKGVQRYLAMQHVIGVLARARLNA